MPRYSASLRAHTWRPRPTQLISPCGASRTRVRGQGRTHLPFLTIDTFVQPELRTYGVNAWRSCVNSLPERSNLDHLRKQAKDLLRQYRARDPAALAAVRQHLPAANDKSDAELSTMLLQLRDAQSCIARQYGFPSWHELKHYMQLKSDAQTPTSTEAEIAQRRYEIAQRAYEHAKPRTAVPFDPKSFDKYVGYYQLSRRPHTFTHIVRAVRRRQSLIENRHQRVGVFKALCFRGVDRRGWDVYEATFTHGQVEYRIPPLAADGKATDIAPREVP